MPKKIVIIGAGGQARVTRFLIEEINHQGGEYEFAGYVISDLNRISSYDSKDEIIGDISWFEEHRDVTSVAIAIGTPIYRQAVAKDVCNKYPRLEFPVLIHPNVVYDRATCRFEEGVVVHASGSIMVNAIVGSFTYITLCCIIGHEAKIGSGCVIMPGSQVSGGVVLGNGVLVGAGARILQYLKVGDNAIIGAGAIVTQDVPPGVTVVGIPAKPLIK